MKESIFIIFLTLIAFTIRPGYSQQPDNWEWLNPRPQGNTILTMDFANDNVGYAAGSFGTVIKTTDNGINWTKLNANTSAALSSIDFLDPFIGFIGGANQLLKKTTDGGQTWQSLQLPSAPNFNLQDIKFVNQDTGYVLGFFLFESRIWKTTNAGQNWITQTTGGANYLNKLYFIDANNGIAVGGSLGGEIVKTTNGGDVWQLVYTDNYKKQSIKFVNATTGFAGSEQGRMYKTTDAGSTWNFVLSDASIDITSINFINSSTGVAFGSGSAFAKTTDGGSNWYEHVIGNGSSSQYFDAEVTSDGTINAAGSYGAMIRSTDAGATFVSPVNVSEGYITDIKFVNSTTGYAVAGFSGGDILKTTNAGFTWSSQISSYTLPIYGIAFTNETTGYLAGSLTIYKTTNGGINWTSVHTSANDIYIAVCFPNAATGFVTSTSGMILRTTNAGAAWNPLTNPNPGQAYSSVFFVNDNTGYAVSQNNVIKTTDAGSSWNNITTPSGVFNFNNIFFTDFNTGYISSSDGIFKTVNSGNNWSLLNAPVGGYNNVQFRGNYGYAIGGDGKIIKSTDAGASWILQPVVTDNPLYSLFFNSDNFVYAGGIKGTILKTIPTELAVPGISINLKIGIEGLWNSLVQVSDTITCSLRNSTAPFNEIDISKTVLNTNGEGTVNFANAPSGNYYLKITHRNTIETWSAAVINYTTGSNSYDFTTSAAKAFGNNLILKGGRYCNYSGDVNQSGSVDLADMLVVYNDATNFSSGYTPSDIDGNNVTNLTDILVVSNNSAAFVTKQNP